MSPALTAIINAVGTLRILRIDVRAPFQKVLHEVRPSRGHGQGKSRMVLPVLGTHASSHTEEKMDHLAVTLFDGTSESRISVSILHADIRARSPEQLHYVGIAPQGSLHESGVTVSVACVDFSAVCQKGFQHLNVSPQSSVHEHRVPCFITTISVRPRVQQRLDYEAMPRQRGGPQRFLQRYACRAEQPREPFNFLHFSLPRCLHQFVLQRTVARIRLASTITCGRSIG